MTNQCRVAIYVVLHSFACKAPEAPDPALVINFADFATFPAPTSGMEPGTIFRVDGVNTVYTVGRISSDFAVRREFLELPNQSWRASAGSKAFLRLLNHPAESPSSQYSQDFEQERVAHSGSPGFQRESQVTFLLSFKEPIKESIVDTGLSSALRASLLEAHEDLNLRDDYYVVRETISDIGLTYVLDRRAVQELGGALDLKSLVGGAAGMHTESSGRVSLTGNFNGRRRILYKADKLRLQDYVPEVVGRIGKKRHAAATKRAADDHRRVILGQVWEAARRGFDGALKDRLAADSEYEEWSSDLHIPGFDDPVIYFGSRFYAPYVGFGGPRNLNKRYYPDSTRVWRCTSTISFANYSELREEFYRLIKECQALGDIYEGGVESGGSGSDVCSYATWSWGAYGDKWTRYLLVRAIMDKDGNRIEVMLGAAPKLE